MNKNSAEVVIIGAGIIGMTTAHELLKQGYKNVTVISKDDPLLTNSDVAAALWRPYDANPKELADNWSKQSYSDYFDIYYDYLKELERGSKVDNPGISFVVDVEYFAEDTPKPDFIVTAGKLLEQKIELLKQDIKSEDEPTRKAAEKLLQILIEQKEKVPSILSQSKMHPTRLETYASVAPLIDSTLYRKWLLSQYEKKSGRSVVIQTIASLELESSDLEALSKNYDIIVNCSGEQARNLSKDAQTKPIRGLVVITEIPEKLDYCIGVEPNPDLDDGKINIAYAIIRPDSKTCVLGGTYEESVDSIPSDEEKNAKDKEVILSRVIDLIPGVQSVDDLKIITTKEGFRCGRDSMYSDMKIITVDDKPILIGGSFGHGGGGYSVAPGAACDIVERCNQLMPDLDKEFEANSQVNMTSRNK